MFSARLGHRCGQLGVGQADDRHDHAARRHRQYRPERARGADPVAGQHHPAEADHGPEPEREDVPVAENFQQGGIVGLGCHVSVHGLRPFPSSTSAMELPVSAGSETVALVRSARDGVSDTDQPFRVDDGRAGDGPRFRKRCGGHRCADCY